MRLEACEDSGDKGLMLIRNMKSASCCLPSSQYLRRS